MNTFRMGFKVNGARIGDKTKHLTWVADARPAWMTYLNDIALCEQAYAVSNGQCNVIDRFYDSREGSQWRTDNPYQYAESKRDGRPHIWKYVLNEPSTGTLGETQQRNDWLATVASETVKYGYRAVIGNFAQGDIELDHIHAGAYDNLLRVIAEHPDKLKLGYHEYTGLFLPMTRHGWYPDMYTDKLKVQPSDWRYLDHDDPNLRMFDYRAGIVPEFYHLFRWTWLQHRCIQITGKTIGFVMTEFGHDRMVDWEQQRSPNIYQDIEATIGTPPDHPVLRGAYSHKNLWADYFPTWSFNESLLKQWQWYEANCNEWVEGICPFMISFGDEWDYFGFNYGSDDILLNDLVAWSQAIEVEPPTIPDDEETPDMIDTLDYLRGDGHLYALDWDFPGHQFQHGTQYLKTDIEGRRFFHVKGRDNQAQWEELWFTDEYIWRGTDTSPNELELYQIRENWTNYGAPWIPRNMKVGDRFNINAWVTFRYKATNNGQWEAGDPVPNKPPYLFPHSIELKKIHPVYQFRSNLTLPDVIELWGYDGNGVNFEQYFYAKNYGLVGWNDPNKGWESWLSHHSVGDTISRQTIAWLTLPDLPPLNDEQEQPTVIDFPLTDDRWTYAFITTSGVTNIRADASTNDLPIFTITGFNHALILRDESITQGGYTWIPVRFAAIKTEDFGDKGAFTKSGWVASGVVKIEDYVPDNEPEDPTDPPDDDIPPTDSDPRVFKYIIPSAEIALTRAEAENIARIILWGVGKLQGFPIEAVEKVLTWLTWLANFLLNFHDMIEDHDSIMVFEREEDETPNS